MRPKTPQEYLLQTEHAVRHLYEGIASCWAYYQQALKHWDISKIGQSQTPENKAALSRYLELATKYFDLKFSEGAFAGSILQIAAMGIRYFSRNESIPESCREIVPARSKAIQFCIGKELYGLPIGLIIYAARNQYNHWDDESPHEITTNVFNVLSRSFKENTFADLAFSLSNPSITVYANEVLLVALGWITYEKYVSEMETLLSND